MSVETVENLDDSFGDGLAPQSGNSQKENVKYFDLKKPTNTYRILPPMFSGRENNRWAVFYARHWGFKNQKGQHVPFVCTQRMNFNTKEVEQSCHFCDSQEEARIQFKKIDRTVQELREHQQDAEKAGNAALVSKLKEELKEAVEVLQVARKAYSSPERKFWVNAMDESGNFGILGLPKTVYEQLAGKRNKDGSRLAGLVSVLYDKHEIDALSVNQGVWFHIVRSGSDLYDTRYAVSVKTETTLVEGANGKKQRAEFPKEAPLSASQKAQALKACRDLSRVFDHARLTDEQADAVINGTPSAVSDVDNRPMVNYENRIPSGEDFGSTPVSRPVSSITKTVKMKENMSDAELLEFFKNT